MKARAFFVALSVLACACEGESSRSSLSGNDSANPGANPAPTQTAQPAPTGTAAPLPTGGPGPAVLPEVAALIKERAFTSGGKRLVPSDFQEMSVTLDIDNGARTAAGTSIVRLQATETGYPYFIFDGSIGAVKVNGVATTTSRVQDPAGQNSLVVINQPLTAGQIHLVEIGFTMPSDAVGYRTGGVGFVTAMADITSGNFLEAYIPANFEDDQFQLTWEVALKGVTNTHQIFSNGRVTDLGGFRWKVEYPSYFTSSSPYLHVTDAALSVKRGTYAGLTKTIPLTVYAADSGSATSGFNALSGLFRELESTYGPYLHESFTAYISGSGGMEHDGATITSLSALGHELTHSWFGRGIMPASGNNGWMDEAVASWRDYGYVRGSTSYTRSPTDMADFSVFERFTPYNVYADGESLLSDLDGKFASSHGGLRPLLKEYFAAHKSHVVTTHTLRSFLENRTGSSLGTIFDRYVYGRSTLLAESARVDVDAQAETEASAAPQPSEQRRGMHPPALTREEIERIR